MPDRLLHINAPGTDSDAAAFITAAGITDLVQQMALHQLVYDFKLFGLWSKMLAIYPFVGGTAATHKWNLKDPRDLDAAYRLVFAGGWVHSATGSLPNGTTGYADTKLPGATLSNTSLHLSFYSRTNASVSSGLVPWDMGVQTGTVTLCLGCGRTFDSLTLFTNNGGAYLSSTVTPYTGLYVGSRVGSGNANISMYRNGPLISGGSSATSGTTGTLTGNVFLGATNNGSGTATNFSNRECGFASAGDGLTANDVLNLYSIVQKFNGWLNRAV